MRAARLELAGAALCLGAAVSFAVTVVSMRLDTKRDHGSDLLAEEVLVPTANQPGVVVIPGEHRALIIESTPEGADVLLKGALRGQTPLTQDFTCAPGEVVPLEVKRRGFVSQVFQLSCVDGSTRVQVTLKPRK